MEKLKKSVVAVGMGAGLLAGGAAGVILGVPAFAGAGEVTTSTVATEATTTTVNNNDKTTTTTETPTTTGAPTTTDKPDEAPTTTTKSDDKPAAPSTSNGASDKSDPAVKPDRQAKRSEYLQAALKPLVEAGTITQAQADAVIKALGDARPPRGDLPTRGEIRQGFHRARVGIESVANLLDMTPMELGKAIMGGQTVAEIAESKGVEPQKVIDTLTAEVKKGLDSAVDKGRITREQADERLTKAAEAITDGVNNGSFDLKDLLGRPRHGG